jgi:hypothetical protein
MLYNIDVEKFFDGEYWTNHYLLDADQELSQMGFYGALVTNMERNFHKGNVNFTKWRVSTTTPNDDQYITNAVGLPGLVSVGSTGYLPLFNVVRVDLNSDVGGRPGRKYYRLPLMEGEVQNGAVDSGVLTIVQDALEAGLAQMLANSVQLLISPNKNVSSFVPAVAIGMRQLRRGSKRKATPILP